MSTVKTTNLQHPSASDVGITLGADGSVVLPQGFTGGIGSNVVSAFSTTSFSTTSATPVDITNMAVTITPSTATSRVLIIGVIGSISNTSTSSSVRTSLFISKSSTDLFHAVIDNLSTTSGDRRPATVVFLDSPATASPVEYKLRGSVSGSTSTFATSLTMMAIEVAA